MQPARSACGATRRPGTGRRSGPFGAHAGGRRRRTRSAPWSRPTPPGQPQVPGAVGIPGVRLEEVVLVLGARLNVAPDALEHVVVGVDQASCVGDGSLVEEIVRHDLGQSFPAAGSPKRRPDSNEPVTSSLRTQRVAFGEGRGTRVLNCGSYPRKRPEGEMVMFKKTLMAAVVTAFIAAFAAGAAFAGETTGNFPVQTTARTTSRRQLVSLRILIRRTRLRSARSPVRIRSGSCRRPARTSSRDARSPGVRSRRLYATRCRQRSIPARRAMVTPGSSQAAEASSANDARLARIAVEPR